MAPSQGRPPAGEVRERAREILSRAEFDRTESLLQRIVDWFSELFSRITFGIGGGSGLLGNVIGLVILGVIVYLLVRLVRALLDRERGPRDEDDDELTIELEPGRAASDWRSEAERFEAEGHWREAMRARYRELVRSLVETGVLDDVPGRTTGEYRRAFVAARPGAADAFSTLTELFELVWYGGAETDADDNRRFRALADAARGRAPVAV